MVAVDDKIKKIQGTEGIILHNNCIILGMQKPKRWYILPDGGNAAIVKTIGGQLEECDKNNSKSALIREISEEIKGIKSTDITINDSPIFTKKVNLAEINPYKQNINLIMEADFYLVRINDNVEFTPNDLPALFKIPINDFKNLEFCKNILLSSIEKYMVINKTINFKHPKYCAFMIPNEVKEIIKRI